MFHDCIINETENFIMGMSSHLEKFVVSYFKYYDQHRGLVVKVTDY